MIALIAAVGLLWAGGAQAGQARRIASLNLCADQLLLSLVERERIAALSPFSDRPTMAYFADRARGIAKLRGTAEEVIALKADVVLVGQYGVAAARDMLAAQGIRIIEIPLATSIEVIRQTLRDVGDALDVRPGADALIARLDAALSQTPPSPALDVLPIERRGWVEGADTVYSDLLRAGGFANAGARVANTPFGSIVPLERIIKAKIPYALMSGTTLAKIDDQGAAMMVHPALARLYPPERRVLTPEALMSCPVVTAPEIIAFFRSEHRRIIGTASP